ncbi:MAG: hypothetical protein C4551_04330 [Bacillota bacterium]|nr:MAG: hypothetical protein C4551_04330 [Bacillota bacterium]
MEVPPFLLQKLYEAGSLRNTATGFRFVLKNSLAPATLSGIEFVKAQGETYLGTVMLRHAGKGVPAASITDACPLVFPMDESAEVVVEGRPFPPGRHKVVLGVRTKEVGPLNIEIVDSVGSGGAKDGGLEDGAAGQSPAPVGQRGDPLPSPGPASSEDVVASGRPLQELITGIVEKVARYLYGCQVVTGDVTVELPLGETASVEYAFLRHDPGPYRLFLRRTADGVCVRGEAAGGVRAEGGRGGAEWFGPLNDGEFFRVCPSSGRVRSPSGGAGGVTFRLRAHDGSPGTRPHSFTLEAYDRGGIWDDLPNMEAFRYEPQVAASYYADAYAAYVFAWMHRTAARGDKGGAENPGRHDGPGAAYGEAAALALDFVCRVYPQYQPCVMDACTHTDFRNPVFVETVEEFMAGPTGAAAGVVADAATGTADGARAEALARWRGLYACMVPDDSYSPTNVWALRYHWAAALLRYAGPGAQPPLDPVRVLEPVLRDRTGDGLIHDNNLSEISFGGYRDAHDMTYHLYTLACLARGHDYLPLPEVWETLRRGAAFSLALTTPGGEVSYLGRGANNVYHLACAVYVFLRVAAGRPAPGESEDLAPRLRRAARLILGYLRRFQALDGRFPTALNAYPRERMGWNHCHTPYNGLSAYFLIRALDCLGGGKTGSGEHATEEQPLALEGDASILFREARYAARSTGRLYLVVFGGNDLSYPYSGLHRTGVAGVAALGPQGRASLLPILEQSLREGEWSTSDLPDIVNDETGRVSVPAGPGSLELGPGGAISLEISYGGFRVERTYDLEGDEVGGDSLVLDTRMTCLEDGRYRLVGVPGLAVRADEGHAYRVEGASGIEGPSGIGDITLWYRGPGGGLRLDGTGCRRQTLGPSSTSRGLHMKVARVVSGKFTRGETYTYRTRIQVSG